MPGSNKAAKTEYFGPEDFSNSVKKRLASSTRTGQACDRCKVGNQRIVLVHLCLGWLTPDLRYAKYDAMGCQGDALLACKTAQNAVLLIALLDVRLQEDMWKVLSRRIMN
jgi:hypothetical protein